MKSALQRTVHALEEKADALREQIAALKENIIEGCKQALSEFKERGVSALDNLARFFHLRQGLESMKETTEKAIAIDSRAIARIEAVSAQYHEAGKHLKNAGRALMGKEAVQEAKPMGKVAKAVAAPYRTDRACLLAMKGTIEKAVSRLERLEQAAEKKPSILQTMREQGEKSQTEPEKKAPSGRDAER